MVFRAISYSLYVLFMYVRMYVRTYTYIHSRFSVAPLSSSILSVCLQRAVETVYAGITAEETAFAGEWSSVVVAYVNVLKLEGVSCR